MVFFNQRKLLVQMASKASSNLPSPPGEAANGGNRRLGITVFSGGMFNCGFEYYEERKVFEIMVSFQCHLRE